MFFDFDARLNDFLGATSAGPEILLPDQTPSATEPGRLPSAGQLHLGSVDLGSGKPVVHRSGELPATLWVTDAPVSDAATAWWGLVKQFPATGLWPLVLQGLYDGSGRPWANGELEPVREAEIDALDPADVLEGGWHGWLVPINNPWAPGEGPLAPFGPGFPGLAPIQRAVAERPLTFTDGDAHLGLVRCRRPADAVALAGWLGAINRTSSVEISAVLRSWEDRFGVILTGLGFATMTLLVSRPPTSEEDALGAAAEVAALCPDALWQPEALWPYEEREPSLHDVSVRVVRHHIWRLWFD